MKIDCIRTYHLRCELEDPFGYSQLTFTHRNALLVEVVADSGESGWGECYGPSEVIQSAITACYGPRLLGHDPLRTEAVWHAMWQTSLDFALGGVMMAAISGIDMALWDLKGKLLGVPVAELMGGRLRDQVTCYATGMYFRDMPEDRLIDALVSEAMSYQEQGFRAMKIKVGKNPAFDERLVVAMRRALPEATLMADANHAFDLPEAIRIGKLLQEHGFLWFEEPLSPQHPELFARLHAKLDVALATGECEQTRYGFQRLLSPGGVGIAQPDLAYCGGPSEALKIRAVASSLGVNVIPHAWGTMLNLSAALHFLACAYMEPGRAESAEPVLEYDRSPNRLREELFETPLRIEGGIAHVPTAPGLGVTVDRSALKAFLVRQTEQ